MTSKAAELNIRPFVLFLSLLAFTVVSGCRGENYKAKSEDVAINLASGKDKRIVRKRFLTNLRIHCPSHQFQKLCESFLEDPNLESASNGLIKLLEDEGVVSNTNIDNVSRFSATQSLREEGLERCKKILGRNKYNITTVNDIHDSIQYGTETIAGQEFYIDIGSERSAVFFGNIPISLRCTYTDVILEGPQKVLDNMKINQTHTERKDIDINGVNLCSTGARFFVTTLGAWKQKESVDNLDPIVVVFREKVYKLYHNVSESDHDSTVWDSRPGLKSNDKEIDSQASESSINESQEVTRLILTQHALNLYSPGYENNPCSTLYF